MRGTHRASLVAAQVALLALLMGCSADETSQMGQMAKSSAVVRATRRAFDGAPPVIAHEPFSSQCMNCHSMKGITIEGLGSAPPNPHTAASEKELGQWSRCTQCHVYSMSKDLFVETDFRGLKQDLRHGRRQSPIAPPVIPHQKLLRGNCAACHTGPAAREEIRCPHPERTNCTQCHVPTRTDAEFSRS